jgi:hypothetical protein
MNTKLFAFVVAFVVLFTWSEAAETESVVPVTDEDPYGGGKMMMGGGKMMMGGGKMMMGGGGKMMMGGGKGKMMGGGGKGKMMGGGGKMMGGGGKMMGGGGMPMPMDMMMGGKGGPMGPGSRAGVVQAAMALYNQRSSEHYTQGSQRWSGITGKIMPPNAPAYSDCSAAATWCYWTQYGSGPDFLNGENWKAGYTGTLTSHGKSVSCSAMQDGDLVFYGSPVSHVAIYVGNGKVVSHGSDPVSWVAYNYRSVNSCRSYL